jgi:protein-S-isoprenylcysteine O-methyltransferase Ste14
VYIWFWFSILGIISILPLYFLSLEHTKLQKKFGEEKGRKFGDILGMISGWGFFIFLFGIWVSPQPKFNLPLLENEILIFSEFSFSIPLLHLIIFSILIIPTLWISLVGVKNVTLKVAETHRPEKVVSGGVYSLVRHPQYLGAFLAHISLTFLFSAEYSLIVTPIIAIYLFVISKKEEKELLNEFNGDYRKYMEQVPMFLPKLIKKDQS